MGSDASAVYSVAQGAFPALTTAHLFTFLSVTHPPRTNGIYTIPSRSVPAILRSERDVLSDSLLISNRRFIFFALIFVVRPFIHT